MLVVGPNIPIEMRPFALAVIEAIRELQAPGSPSPLFACPLAQLPPPGRWANCVLRVSNLDVLAVSNGTAWIRQDTGAAI